MKALTVPHTSGRRAALHAGAWALATVALAGCGFHLRGQVDLGYQRIALAGFGARSATAEAFRHALPSSTQVVPRPQEAEVVLTALDDKFTRNVVATTSAGQVRELSLTVTLKYRLTQPDGQVLVADTSLEQSRNLSYTESSALAKEYEEAMLLREMRADIASQLLRMLATTSQRRR